MRTLVTLVAGYFLVTALAVAGLQNPPLSTADATRAHDAKSPLPGQDKARSLADSDEFPIPARRTDLRNLHSRLIRAAGGRIELMDVIRTGEGAKACRGRADGESWPRGRPSCGTLQAAEIRLQI